MPRPKDIRSLLPLLLCTCLVASQGCGSGQPPAYPTKGHVTFANGSPVRTGTIELKSREHSIQARGTIGPDGQFILTTYREGDGAVAGVHDCVIVQMVVVEDLKARNHGVYGVVNPKHASYQTSGLTCTVEPKAGNELTVTVEGVGKLVEGGSEKDHKLPKKK